VKPASSAHVQVYDGARVLNSQNGNKVKFLKGEEYEGNRTLNIISEAPPRGTTAGPQSPHVEHLSYRIYREFGVLASQCDWYRVIDRGNHTQRILIQQPNEQFIKINNRDPNGNIYKIAYNEPGGYTKKTNLDEGDDDYRELFQHVNVNNRTNLSEALRRYLVIEEVMAYEVVTNLLSHWDGIKNNIFLYHNPPPIDKWEMIPWDIDKTFGYLDSDPMYWKMPIDFPKTGYAPGTEAGAAELNARHLVGPIGRPFHMDPVLHEEYAKRVAEALDGLFSLERVQGMIDQIERVLLEDLELLEQHSGRRRDDRRNQIINSYSTMRRFLRLRHEYLRSQLPTGFYVSRDLPGDSYQAGSTISGVKVIVSIPQDQSATLKVVESIPEGFRATVIRVTSGESTILENTIIWNLFNFSGEASLIYDLSAPTSNPPFAAAITGSVFEGTREYPTRVSELRLASGLGPDWVVGTGGIWAVADGVLNCFANTDHDPKHVWLDRDFETTDYTVKADVRMLDWRNGDYARAGVAVCVNPDDGERALNILFHEDTGSVDLLNDLVSWGTRANYTWEIGEWYTMTLQSTGSVLEGSIKKRGSNEAPFLIRWDDPRYATRSPGFPGLTGSTLTGLTAQFDNFEVIVRGKVVFSDDFDAQVNVVNWEIY
jgi:hypothetical protein